MTLAEHESFNCDLGRGAHLQKLAALAPPASIPVIHSLTMEKKLSFPLWILHCEMENNSTYLPGRSAVRMNELINVCKAL